MIESLNDTRVRRILFVGRDSRALKPFREAASTGTDGWTIDQACSPSTALEILEHRPVQIIVVETKGTTAEAHSFLDTVMARQPQATRILLSDSPSIESML